MADFDTVVARLRAVAEETRLRILAVCHQGELSVTELTQILGQSQPRVSRHLKVLQSAGLLLRFRERHSVLYRTVTQGEAAELISHLLAQMPGADPLLEHDRARLRSIRLARAESAAQYLRFHAEDWHRLLDVSIGSGEFNRAVLSALEHSGRGELGELLDIGTGTGRILKLLGRHAASAVGIDRDPRMLKVARAALAESRLERAMVRQADMYNMPFASNSFDTVAMDQILFEADRPAEVVAEAARVLRPGGRLLIVDFEHSGPAAKALTADDGARFGVQPRDVEAWLRRSGLESRYSTRLESDALTVMLTVAEPRPASGVAA